MKVGKPFEIGPITVMLEDPVDHYRMSFRRCQAVVGYRNIKMNFGVVPSLGAKIDYSGCKQHNRAINQYTFSGSEWLPKMIVERKVDIPIEM